MEQPPNSLGDLQPQDLTTSSIATVIDLTKSEERVLNATSLDAFRMVTSPGWYPTSGTSSPTLPFSDTGSTDITLQSGDQIQPNNAFSHTTVTLSYVSRSHIFTTHDSLTRHSPLPTSKLSPHPHFGSEEGLGDTGYALNQHYSERVDGPVDVETRTELFQLIPQAHRGPEIQGGVCLTQDPHEVNGEIISKNGPMDEHKQGQEEHSQENNVMLENGEADRCSSSGLCSESSLETPTPISSKDDQSEGPEVVLVMAKNPDPAGTPDRLGAQDLCSLSKEYISPLEDPLSPSTTSQHDVEDLRTLPQASSSPSCDNCYPEATDGLDELSTQAAMQPDSDFRDGTTRFDSRTTNKLHAERQKAALEPLIDLTHNVYVPDFSQNKLNTVIPHMNGNAKAIQRTLRDKKLPLCSESGTQLESIVMNINSSRYKVSGCIRTNKKAHASQSTANNSTLLRKIDTLSEGKRTRGTKTSFSERTANQKAVIPVKRGKINDTDKSKVCATDFETNNSKKSNGVTRLKSPPKISEKEPEPPSQSTVARLFPHSPPQSVSPKSQGKTKGKATGSKTSPTTKRKGAPTLKGSRKKRKKSQSNAMFSPKEPEIRLRYANYKEEKRDLRSDNFSPFIRVERQQLSPSRCSVINYSEDVGTQHKKSQQAQPGGFIPTVVPSTSCLQLGRASMHCQNQRSLVCCLCRLSANAMDLGDLHGPYYPEGYRPNIQTPAAVKEDDYNFSDSDSSSCCTRSRGGKRPSQHTPQPLRPGGHLKEKSLAVSRVRTGDCTDGPAAKRAWSDAGSGDVEDWYSPPVLPQEDCEYWLHEDCGIWSAGVFLVKGKVYGLEEAVKVAQETLCSACRDPGATLGCFFKSCPNKFHYRCALESDCVLIEENFSMKCKKHKNKTFKAPAGTR